MDNITSKNIHDRNNRFTVHELLRVITRSEMLISGKGADADVKTKKGRAAIHCAALYGHTEVLAQLLKHEAMVNIQVSILHQL